MKRDKPGGEIRQITDSVPQDKLLLATLHLGFRSGNGAENTWLLGHLVGFNEAINKLLFLAQGDAGNAIPSLPFPSPDVQAAACLPSVSPPTQWRCHPGSV